MLFALLLLIASPVYAGAQLPAAAAASGAARAVVGPDPYAMKNTVPAMGTINLSVYNVGDRWSHVQNIDRMRVEATFGYGDSSYRVVVQQAMPRHPLGRYTTWFGVAYHEGMHGKTGIGTDAIPRVQPEIALWGWAQVGRDGRLMSKMAPAHVMVMAEGLIPGITLEISTEDKSLLGTQDGYLHLYWPQVERLSMPDAADRRREWLAWGLMGVAVLTFGWLASREQAEPEE